MQTFVDSDIITKTEIAKLTKFQNGPIADFEAEMTRWLPDRAVKDRNAVLQEYASDPNPKTLAAVKGLKSVEETKSRYQQTRQAALAACRQFCLTNVTPIIITVAGRLVAALETEAAAEADHQKDFAERLGLPHTESQALVMLRRKIANIRHYCEPRAAQQAYFPREVENFGIKL